MSRRLLCAGAVLAVLAGGAPARAGAAPDRPAARPSAPLPTPLSAQPLVLPRRDVSVVYRVQGDAGRAIPGGIPGSVRVSWTAARQMLRVEPEGRTQVLLVDLGARRVEMVDSGLHTAMSMPVREKDLQPLTLGGAQLTRRGPAVVAGLACTEYAVQSARGQGVVCLTADGVALRADGTLGGRHGSFTAVSVAYGAQPPASFEVPQGYSQFDLSRLGLAR